MTLSFDEVIERLEMEHTFHFYDIFSYPVIDSTELTPVEVAEEIIKMVE